MRTAIREAIMPKTPMRVRIAMGSISDDFEAPRLCGSNSGIRLRSGLTNATRGSIAARNENRSPLCREFTIPHEKTQTRTAVRFSRLQAIAASPQESRSRTCGCTSVFVSDLVSFPFFRLCVFLVFVDAINVPEKSARANIGDAMSFS
jgi:hypothetical protein